MSMNDPTKIATGLAAAKDFAKATGNNYCDTPDSLLPYYMYAQRKEEGFDAILQTSEGDKWGCESHWYGLRGTPEHIAAEVHNEKLRVFCKGPDYFSVDLVLDLNRPIESQMAFGRPDRDIKPAFADELQKLKDTLGEAQATGHHVESRSFSRFTMLDEIQAATPPAPAMPA